MSEIIKISRRYSNRFLSWHDVISARTEFHRKDINHAGRYYQMIHGIGADDYLEKEWYEQDCINYLIENYVHRDTVHEIMEEHTKLHNLEWIEIGKDTYKCNNFKIHCRHLDYKITESIHLFGDVSLIQQYESESMEDAFGFILNAIKRGNE